MDRSSDSRNIFQRRFFRGQGLAIAVAALALARSAHGYVDLAPTLTSIINASRTVSLVEVVELQRDSKTLVLREIKRIKGEPTATNPSAPPANISHPAAPPEGTIPRPIAQWATPGSRGILFNSPTAALVCFGDGWYQVRKFNGVWKMSDKDRPDLALAYYGNVSRLQAAIEEIVAGKTAVITVLAYAGDNDAASFDLALNRQNLPGLARLQRVRLDKNTPAGVWLASSNPSYFVGSGVVDAADLPALIGRLKDPEPLVRAEAADDIRSLGRKGRSAVGALKQGLNDSSPQARFAAAAAVLAIEPPDAAALEVLAKGLGSADVVERRVAARAAGGAGKAAAPLALPLGALLKEVDESTRINALLSITVLGATAAPAVRAVIPLLDETAWKIDAADALGRIGPAAREALPKLTPMLESPENAVRWAAVRAISQIGGEGAHPAVTFMIKALPGATEVEAYNMMIYLALLGPVAVDALPAIENTRIKNPILPGATRWAMAVDKKLPWQNVTGMFGPGGFGATGGAPGGAGGNLPDIFTVIYSNYVHELGERLRPATKMLAEKIMDDTAADVPVWGYGILRADAPAALAILTPYLANSDLALRERATVAIGYMGESGAPASVKLEAALKAAPTLRERLLIQWSLQAIQGE